MSTLSLSSSSPLEVTQENGVAEVILSRPDQHNSLNMPLIEALLEVIQQLHGQRDLRAVILTGAGASFCSGLDVAGVMADPKNIHYLLSGCDGYPHNKVQHLALGWRSLSVPVIAAIQGHCYGGGLQIALGADLRVAHPQSKLSVMEGRWGIIPDMGLSVTARGCVREDLLLRLTLTAEILSGDEALQAGLVTETAAEPLARAREVAAILTQRSPDMVKASKRLLRDSYTQTDDERLAMEEKLQKRLLGSANQMEAVRANLEKRAPHFKTE
ncbi:crotonase/enoyl-CoA hydratase family protein [Marinospirillum perlucidum]|uniref:crotonase/enoyl-CoA hydratase family protein n=1 Tax=Marinospirillum perlucidum TaxID=1982602 RepID=UPI000DF262A1|nr:crotonase/enoyl-CoA hydratase family protein [Marinospirillum perlucidum]